MPVDAVGLAASLRDLLGGGLDEGGLEPKLRDAVEAACAIFRVDGAGLTLAAEHGTPLVVQASDEVARALERAQDELGAGPCVDTHRRRAVVSVPDLASAARWSQLWAVVAPLGVRAVLSAPVWLRNAPVGNLDLYSAEAREWDAAEAKALAAYAGVVSALVHVAAAGARVPAAAVVVGVPGRLGALEHHRG